MSIYTKLECLEGSKIFIYMRNLDFYTNAKRGLRSKLHTQGVGT